MQALLAGFPGRVLVVRPCRPDAIQPPSTPQREVPIWFQQHPVTDRSTRSCSPRVHPRTLRPPLLCLPAARCSRRLRARLYGQCSRLVSSSSLSSLHTVSTRGGAGEGGRLCYEKWSWPPSGLACVGQAAVCHSAGAGRVGLQQLLSLIVRKHSSIVDGARPETVAQVPTLIHVAAADRVWLQPTSAEPVQPMALWRQNSV